MSATTPTLSKRADRLRLAVKEIKGEFEQIVGRIKEVQNDLTLVIASLDELEAERNQMEKS